MRPPQRQNNNINTRTGSNDMLYSLTSLLEQNETCYLEKPRNMVMILKREYESVLELYYTEDGTKHAVFQDITFDHMCDNGVSTYVVYTTTSGFNTQIKEMAVLRYFASVGVSPYEFILLKPLYC